MSFWAMVCLAGLSFCLAACDGEKEKAGQALQVPPPLVSVVEMERQDVPLYSVFMGQTAGSLSAAVKPQVTGILQARLFAEGAKVEGGAPLFKIDPAPFKASLDQAKGQLASAQSRFENARRENTRVQKLYKVNAVSQQERDSARASFHSAKADVESARASVDEARIRLGYTDVVAPLSGWASREVSTIGSLVSPESVLTYINQNDPMDVLFAVPSAELSAMREMEAKGRARSYGQGSQAYLRLQDGTEYQIPGEVIFLDTQVDSATNAVRAKARFSNPQGLLLPGQFAAVRVGGASLIKALMLPQAAIMQTEGGPAVYVLDAEGRAIRKLVQLGSAFGAEFLVEGGLEEGQKVIVQGQDKVKPGQKVTAEFRKGQGSTAGKALEAPGSSKIPAKKGGVEDAPAPVFPKPDADIPQKEERHD